MMNLAGQSFRGRVRVAFWKTIRSRMWYGLVGGLVLNFVFSFCYWELSAEDLRVFEKWAWPVSIAGYVVGYGVGAWLFGLTHNENVE